MGEKIITKFINQYINEPEKFFYLLKIFPQYDFLFQILFEIENIHRNELRIEEAEKKDKRRKIRNEKCYQ